MATPLMEQSRLRPAGVPVGTEQPRQTSPHDIKVGQPGDRRSIEITGSNIGIAKVLPHIIGPGMPVQQRSHLPWAADRGSIGSYSLFSGKSPT